MTHLKCHGHGCPERHTCRRYTPTHVQDDTDKGDNNVKCEYYVKK
jgi:hypothetical protein